MRSWQTLNAKNAKNSECFRCRDLEQPATKSKWTLQCIFLTENAPKITKPRSFQRLLCFHISKQTCTYHHIQSMFKRKFPFQICCIPIVSTSAYTLLYVHSRNQIHMCVFFCFLFIFLLFIVQYHKCFFVNSNKYSLSIEFYSRKQ